MVCFNFCQIKHDNTERAEITQFLLPRGPETFVTNEPKMHFTDEMLGMLRPGYPWETHNEAEMGGNFVWTTWS